MRPLAALSLACVFGQDIAAPRMGTMLDRSGSIRAVYGVAASFIPGPALAGGVLSMACSAELCLAKTAAALGETPAPPGSAVIGLDGRAAWVYFPAISEFARWEDGAITTLDWQVDGEVLSISPDARIAVRRQSGTWIVARDGATLDAIPGATGPVLLLADTAVFAAAEELVLQRADRGQARFALTGIESIALMGEGWVQIATPSGLFGLDLRREALYVLPGSAE